MDHTLSYLIILSRTFLDFLALSIVLFGWFYDDDADGDGDGDDDDDDDDDDDGDDCVGTSTTLLYHGSSAPPLCGTGSRAPSLELSAPRRYRNLCEHERLQEDRCIYAGHCPADSHR